MFRFQGRGFGLQEVEGRVGKVLGLGGAVAVVVGGGGEELVLGEQAGALELFDGFVNEFFLVDDAQGQCADKADGEEEDAEEEEEAEDVDVASAAVGSLLVEEVCADLALPHAAQAKGGDGDGQRNALCVAASKVLCACCHGGQVHAARAHAHGEEGQHHDAEGPAVSTSRRRGSALVGKRSDQVAKAKEDAAQGRRSARPQAITQVSKQRHRQVHAQLGDDADDVDLELRVVQTALEQVAVQRVGGDAPRAQAVDNGPDEAQPAHQHALQSLAVALHDALGDLLEEAAGVAVVVAGVVVAADVGARQQRAARRVVVELVDAQVLAVGAAALGRGWGRHGALDAERGEGGGVAVSCDVRRAACGVTCGLDVMSMYYSDIVVTCRGCCRAQCVCRQACSSSCSSSSSSRRAA